MFFRSVTIHSKKGSIVALLAPKFKKNEIVGLIRRTALGLRAKLIKIGGSYKINRWCFLLLRVERKQ
jgi:hypothetical protein